MSSKAAFGFVMLLGLASVGQGAVPATTQLASPKAATAAEETPTVAPADLALGGEVILRLRAAAGGMTPQQRVSVIEDRLANVLGTPKITPADVAVYTPKGGAPVVYALGRRLITVDAATVRATGGTAMTPLEVATRWAKRFQQVLPRINWRPSNAPETVVPANPPLTITTEFTEVGGNAGSVTLRGKTVLTLHGPQHGGLTAQERADILTARLERLANKPIPAPAPGGTATPVPGLDVHADAAEVLVANTPFVTVDPAEAKASGSAADVLAKAWASHIRAALKLSDPNALPAALSATAPPVPGIANALPVDPSPAAPTVPQASAPAPPVVSP